MKIRQGFVSNSSSSSFIVTEPNLTTTARVALMMLSVVMEEYDTDGYLTDDLLEEMENAIDYLLNNIGYDEPICFPWGVNYETFIRRTEDGIYVDTCNNHPWWDYFSCANVESESDDEDWSDTSNKYLDLDTLSKVDRQHYYRKIMGEYNIIVNSNEKTK